MKISVKKRYLDLKGKTISFVKSVAFCSTRDILMGFNTGIKINDEWIADADNVQQNRQHFLEALNRRGLIKNDLVVLTAGTVAKITDVTDIAFLVDIEGLNVTFEWPLIFTFNENSQDPFYTIVKLLDVKTLHEQVECTIGKKYDDEVSRIARHYAKDNIVTPYSIRNKLSSMFQKELFTACGVLNNPKAIHLYQFIVNLCDPQSFETMEYEFKNGVDLIK